jgi:hypothetical protein
MLTAPYVEFEPLLTPDQLEQVMTIVRDHAPYPTYGEGREQKGFGAGIAQRYDAARNFVQTRPGQDEVGKLASRTNYLRYTFAYEQQMFPVIAFFVLLGGVGAWILPVLATDNLVSLPSVPVSVVQSVIPITAVLIIVAEISWLIDLLTAGEPAPAAGEPSLADGLH